MRHFQTATMSLLMLGFADQAVADNVSTVDQIGANNAAIVDQASGSNGVAGINQSNESGDGDTAVITQSDGGIGGGITNDATVDQIGGSGSQFGSITQDNASDGPTNQASITQTNTQGDNQGLINQSGAGNAATVEQGPVEATIGFTVFPFPTQNNDAVILQLGDANTATTLQGTNSDLLSDQDNLATVEQTGNDNTSDVSQSGLLNSAWVKQGSDDNESTVNQDGGLLLPQGNTATVEQGIHTGTTNNLSIVVQDGALNASDVKQ